MITILEIITTNGFRKVINRNEIASVGELKNNGKSNTVITLKNGDSIFADDVYERVVKEWLA